MTQFRVGTKNPLNVYEGEKSCFQAHTPEDAERFVRLMNGDAAARERERELVEALEKCRAYIEILHPTPKEHSELRAMLSRVAPFGGKDRERVTFPPTRADLSYSDDDQPSNGSGTIR